MKKTPTKKKSPKKVKDVLKVIELPSNNEDMEKYIDINREEINKMMVDNIDYALRKRMAAVEVFSFKNSNFVVLINRRDFKENLENIFEFSLNNEHFEVCGKAKKVIEKVDKFTCFFGFKKINNKYVKEKTFKE
jgi:hypothetical protein